jgi:hypothetical protein
MGYHVKLTRVAYFAGYSKEVLLPGSQQKALPICGAPRHRRLAVTLPVHAGLSRII